ncbi:DnaJ domain-containing protein [Sphingomonas sp. PB2P12]|uniref:J domain-containing protein n=1 Tax=Sphingomonas sandaracina TaxID=3096157 RepID=UPI002FC7CE85
MSQRDFYQVLGVARNASPPDIRAAFVRLAKHHHPDHARSTAELPGRLREIQQAYHCLSEPGARARHDVALVESDRLHVARQRRVRDRLDRYDGRHLRPHPTSNQTPRLSFRRRIRWWAVGVLIVSGAILANMFALAPLTLWR